MMKQKSIALVHDPNDELFPGVLHPDAALFADYLDVRKANIEHRAFRSLLAECGFEVRTVRDLLLEGTIDGSGEVMQGESLEALKSFASGMLEYEGDYGVNYEAQQSYKADLIRKAHPLDLVKIIFNRPKVILHPTNDNTGLAADYIMRPMMNLLFMRDQMIVTAKGSVIGQLHSPQRLGESLVADFCLKKLGIEPIFKIRGEATFLEGGDYILWGETSFIGCGVRTNQLAVSELMKADVFGTKRVVVVKDSMWAQEQMHLDTYFNVIDSDLVTLANYRYLAEKGESAYLSADIYEYGEGGYQAIGCDEPFVGYLTSAGFTILPVSDEDNSAFGCNYLTVRPREIIAVKGKTEKYKSYLRKYGVNVHWTDLTHCTKGYGAAHCLTQIISADQDQIKRAFNGYEKYSQEQ